jgi:hypothetical protein
MSKRNVVFLKENYKTAALGTVFALALSLSLSLSLLTVISVLSPGMKFCEAKLRGNSATPNCPLTAKS